MNLLAVTIVMKNPIDMAKITVIDPVRCFLTGISYYTAFKGGLIMPIHVKIMILSISMAVAFGFTPSNSSAQTTGPAALAAKQEIKAQVFSAMRDGKITQDERRDILLNAKECLSAKEYVSLVETINRLSPPERATPENLGYAPYTDKLAMAQFPTWDLSWIDKSLRSNIIPKQTTAKKAPSPKQNYVVKEIITKQTIIKESVPKQSVAKASPSKQSVVKTTTSKQTIVKTTTPGQKTVVKTTKPDVTSKVVILPSPPQKKNDKQSNPSTVVQVQNKIPKSDNPMPPAPPAVQSQTRYTTADKPVRQKMAETPKKHPVIISDQVTIQQPREIWNEAEKPALNHAYNDYNVPVLSTSAATLQTDRDRVVIKASFDQPLEPDEGSQSIIRQ